MKRYVVVLFCILAVTMVARGRDLSEPPLEIKGAKVAAEADAKRIAFDCYVRKMKANVLATESVKEVSIIKLGYDIRDFATKGNKIWEARVMTLEGQLRGILWIHPETKKVRFVTGAWDQVRPR